MDALTLIIKGTPLHQGVTFNIYHHSRKDVAVIMLSNAYRIDPSKSFLVISGVVLFLKTAQKARSFGKNHIKMTSFSMQVNSM